MPGAKGQASTQRSLGSESRSSGRGWAPFVFAAAVALAAFLLYRTLSRYSLHQIVDGVTALPEARLLAAGAFAAASYLCLTGFDFLALHYVGRPLAYPKVAIASFTSLSLGHNIGFAALSSGAVRYRFYSRWGLEPGEIAKVVLFCGLTVGLGLLGLAGAALLIRSDLAQEITGLSQPVLRALGALCVVLATAYLVLAATVRTPLAIRGWTLEMPPLRLACGQIAVGSLNFACVAACLHQAIAAVVEVPYLAAASVYVIANVTALVSHVPGGLGVIESVVTVLLPEAELIGPLLLFRFVYFLVPLVLGCIVFGVAELVIRPRSAPTTRAAATAG